MLIQMVLATDMSKHFEDVALFRTNIMPPTPNDRLDIKSARSVDHSHHIYIYIYIYIYHLTWSIVVTRNCS